MTAAELLQEARLEGEIEATWRWAWYKDGEQYVGSCGTKYTDAIAPLKKQLEELRAKRKTPNEAHKLA